MLLDVSLLGDEQFQCSHKLQQPAIETTSPATCPHLIGGHANFFESFGAAIRLQLTLSGDCAQNPIASYVNVHSQYAHYRANKKATAKAVALE